MLSLKHPLWDSPFCFITDELLTLSLQESSNFPSLLLTIYWNLLGFTTISHIQDQSMVFLDLLWNALSHLHYLKRSMSNNQTRNQTVFYDYGFIFTIISSEFIPVCLRIQFKSILKWITFTIFIWQNIRVTYSGSCASKKNWNLVMVTWKLLAGYRLTYFFLPWVFCPLLASIYLKVFKIWFNCLKLCQRFFVAPIPYRVSGYYFL